MHLSAKRGSMRWGGLTSDEFEEPCEPSVPKERGVQRTKEDVSVVQGRAHHSTIILGRIPCANGLCGAEPLSLRQTILGWHWGGRGQLFAGKVYIGFAL